MDYLLPHMADLKQFGEVIFYDQRGTGKSIDSDISPAFVNIDQFVKDLEDIRVSLNIERFFCYRTLFWCFSSNELFDSISTTFAWHGIAKFITCRF